MIEIKTKESIKSNNATNVLPRLLTVKDLQKYLNIGRCKVLSLLQTREIPCFKVANQYRVFDCDLKEYLENLKQKEQ